MPPASSSIMNLLSQNHGILKLENLSETRAPGRMGLVQGLKTRTETLYENAVAF